MMVVAIHAEPTFSAGTPRTLFEFKEGPGDAEGFRGFDLAPDGQHFVMIQEGEESAPPTQLRVVVNWFEELKAKVPTGR